MDIPVPTPQSSAVPEIPHSMLGLLLIAVSVLATVTIYLFKLYVGRGKECKEELEKKDLLLASKDTAITAERVEFAKRESLWEEEAQRLETEHERLLKEQAVTYAAGLAELREQQMAREDAMRKDFADRVERLTGEMSRAAQEQVKLQDKMWDRFGPRSRGGAGLR